MHFIESIRVSRLDRPQGEVLDLLREFGGFEVSGRSLVFHGEFSPGRRDQVDEILRSSGVAARVHHSVGPVFEQSDFDAAELFVLLLPQVWIDGASASVTCAGCGRRLIRCDRLKRVEGLTLTGDVLDVNGEIVAVSESTARAIAAGGLKGADLPFFDKRERFHYLLATSDLGPPIIRESEVIGLGGACGDCGLPTYEKYIGPLRYRRRAWNGDDFTHDAFMDNLVVSRASFELLRRIDKRIRMSAPVLLE